MKNFKLFLPAVVLLFLFVSPGIIRASSATELNYPPIPGALTPTTIRTLLPNYINYAFRFAITIAGLIVFGSFVYGGIRYVTSGASPSGQNDARAQIFSSLLGLLILLTSYIILTTINPQLIELRAGLLPRGGIVLYKGLDCPQDQLGTADADGNLNARPLAADTPDLEEFNGNAVRSVGIYGLGRGFLVLEFYRNTAYRDLYESIDTATDRAYDKDPGILCINFFNPPEIRSIKLIWKAPGVYLRNNDSPPKEGFYTIDTATVPSEFNDKVTDIKFLNPLGMKFGAVLHEDKDYKGQCRVFVSEDSASNESWVTVVEDYTYTPVTGSNHGSVGNGVSSLTVFSPVMDNMASGEGVTFYEHDKEGGDDWGPFRSTAGDATGDPPNDTVTSLKIQGNYIVVLFEDSNGGGACEVFTKSDSNLRDNRMGRCHCGIFDAWCGDCMSSFIVIPTR